MTIGWASGYQIDSEPLESPIARSGSILPGREIGRGWNRAANTFPRCPVSQKKGAKESRAVSLAAGWACRARLVEST